VSSARVFDFSLGKLWLLQSWRTSPSPMPKFLLGRCQRPSGTLLHQAPIRIWVRRWVFFCSFGWACDFGTRGLSRTQIAGYPDPFRLPTDQKIFGSKPCPKKKQSLGYTSFEWLTAWAAKMPISLCRRGWGPNQSPGFTSFTRGSPSAPGPLSKSACGDPNIFSCWKGTLSRRI
jgi:hypothetical protein